MICAAGLAALAVLFTVWAVKSTYSFPGYAAAFVSVTLFAILCLRFVPQWTGFWSRGAEDAALPCGKDIPAHEIFLLFLLCDAAVIIAVFIIRTVSGCSTDIRDFLEFWRCTDSRHYLDIAREWYLSEGSIDRLVQLVFLPGYPIAVRLLNYLIGNDIVSGLVVSALSFSVSGCVLYKLLRLDLNSDDAMRCIKFLLISPAAFFFAAPMSESLFFLLSVSCIYLARKRRLLLSCVIGALASFTRSLGLMLMVPVLMELVHDCVNGREKAAKALTVLLIPTGFAAYCYVNYLVAGDPFMFMEYQSSHWHQHLGFFFNTAAYQTEYALRYAKEGSVSLWGLSLPNITAAFASLILVGLAAKKLRPTYMAYFIAYFVIAVGATWLLSAPRYLLVMPAVPLVMTYLSRDKRIDALLTALSAVGYAEYITAFALRWQVW